MHPKQRGVEEVERILRSNRTVCAMRVQRNDAPDHRGVQRTIWGLEGMSTSCDPISQSLRYSVEAYAEFCNADATWPCHDPCPSVQRPPSSSVQYIRLTHYRRCQAVVQVAVSPLTDQGCGQICNHMKGALPSIASSESKRLLLGVNQQLAPLGCEPNGVSH